MSNQLIAGGVMNKRIASFQGISEELKQLDFARTCDYGFLHPTDIPTFRDGKAEMVDGHVLFVLGAMEDVIWLDGGSAETADGPQKRSTWLYPMDVERLVESAHPKFVKDGCIAFRSDGSLSVAVELLNHERYAQTCLPVIVNTVLDAFHVLVKTVIFIQPGKLPRARSGEKQRAFVKDSFEQGTLAVLSVHSID
jgi:hypothetical protein